MEEGMGMDFLTGMLADVLTKGMGSDFDDDFHGEKRWKSPQQILTESELAGKEHQVRRLFKSVSDFHDTVGELEGRVKEIEKEKEEIMEAVEDAQHSLFRVREDNQGLSENNDFLQTQIDELRQVNLQLALVENAIAGFDKLERPKKTDFETVVGQIKSALNGGGGEEE